VRGRMHYSLCDYMTTVFCGLSVVFARACIFIVCILYNNFFVLAYALTDFSFWCHIRMDVCTCGRL
jgi:hypothetical protein